MNYQIPRAYQIARMQYVLCIYYFNQDAIRDYIASQILKGISLSSVGWMLGTQYQIPSGQYVRNSWQIPSSCVSLSQVVILFLTNDHQKWTYCRKQFRLSHNITSFQIKFNTTYYPPQPFIGNAGNPQTIDTTGDNSEFYLNILKSNNFLFNVNTQLPRINRINFSINNRCYDPTNQASFLDPQIQSTIPTSYTWSAKSVNADTAMGMSWFHQNRYIGKAAYVYSFEAFAHSKEFMMGIDSRQARPF